MASEKLVTKYNAKICDIHRDIGGNSPPHQTLTSCNVAASTLQRFIFALYVCFIIQYPIL